ncbi:hypothetical protein EVAR_5397_1 [Eumeta japonica]|uniref:Uncharacterized protein n=1 Tax=Eumeta variegata TaxID=151549 RepID=A0A4C2AC05_EUMVA|nr:hypothetical protein EVAR_5397_1 [Eumeta japonica]
MGKIKGDRRANGRNRNERCNRVREGNGEAEKDCGTRREKVQSLRHFEIGALKSTVVCNAQKLFVVYVFAKRACHNDPTQQMRQPLARMQRLCAKWFNGVIIKDVVSEVASFRMWPLCLLSRCYPVAMSTNLFFSTSVIPSTKAPYTVTNPS